MVLNLTAVGLFTAGLLVRRGHLDDGAVDALPIAIFVAALVLLGASGWLGGSWRTTTASGSQTRGTQAEGPLR